jgi:ribonuclease P protein component
MNNVLQCIDQKLPKAEILRKKTDFNEVFEKGSIWNGIFIKFIYINSNHRMVGFIVSKRFGNAVKRNRAKRLLREAYRKNRYAIGSIKVVLLPKDRFKKVSLKELEDEFKRFGQCIESL